MSHSRVVVAAAFDARARGYVLKSGPRLLWSRALKRVLRGGVALDATLVASQRSSSPRPTPTECHLARLVVAGATNERIAAVMGIAVRTVEGRLTRAFARLGVASRAEFAVFVDGRRWDLLPGG